VTWLTWRQFRGQAATAAAVLVAFGVLLAATGPHLAGLYRSDGVTGCHGGGCPQASGFLASVGAGADALVYALGIAGIVLAPAVIGTFWGAPLIAREFESGTFRLAWTQTITRTRWLAVKLALPGIAAMAVTEGLSLMFGWWAAPISQAARLAADGSFPLGMGPFSLLAFDAHGITPLGYAAFAFTLGVTAGILLRRAIPAMAVTLAVFATVQIAMPLLIRPHLLPPDHAIVAVSSFTGATHMSAGSFAFTVRDLPSHPGVWIISTGAVSPSGQPVSTIPPGCRNQGQSCLASHGIRVAVTYQPTSRYWPIQTTETAIYLVLALTLAAYSLRHLARRS
jgi:hypothetical protein